MKDSDPTSAVVAVTLLCNSKCVMCDIWKNRGLDFLPAELYKKLPSSLRMVDITGGEPFLRPDIPIVVASIRYACPKARILITTNGFLMDRIVQQLPAILNADPMIAFRVSLDGFGKVHETIRGIPNAFGKVEQTIQNLQKAGVKDVGVIFTLMAKNRTQLHKVYDYSKRMNIHFSLNVAHDSPVYFGTQKVSLRPKPEYVKDDLVCLFHKQIKSIDPKDWAKGWFNRRLFDFMKTHTRPLPCGAGENFFYMDSHANIFVCHLKNWPIGNLEKENFETIWRSNAKKLFIHKARRCNDCWISCTAKDTIRQNKAFVLRDITRIIAADLFAGSLR